MKLIVGLGNIGSHYQHTRHNLGFIVIDAFAEQSGMDWVLKSKFKSLVAEGTLGAQKIICIKPTTLYNLSGDAVAAVAAFYKIPLQDIVIVHDELAIPFGTIRVRLGGSDAGNNGIKGIIAALGPDFARIRIGIANEHLATTDASGFVLGQFSAGERQKLGDIKKHAIEQIDAFIQDTFSHSTITV